MANRKVGQEIEKCFKQINLGVDAFDEQYRKYEASGNPSQKEKLVESIKRECKKLQRLRDQVKTWAAGNDVKDKGPLLEKRELIETKMEAFKAIEKEMKTKAFSKEGLTAAAKLDPREKEKQEVREFLEEMNEELGRQIEATEAEIEQLQSQVKRAKRDSAKAERVSELEQTTERHKWHQERLELLMRALDNDGVDAEDVKSIEDSIKDYVENNQEVDFVEDETMYDDFHLDDEEAAYGVPKDLDRVASHEDSAPEPSEPSPVLEVPKAKAKAVTEVAAPPRRPSQQIKSPLPALADLGKMPQHSVVPAPNSMRPAPPPSKPSGEPLKYASAAAAAAATDKAGIGIAPLPPPPTGAIAATASTIRSSSTSSPAVQAALPVRTHSSNAAAPNEKQPATATSRSPAPSHSSMSAPSPAVSSIHPAQALHREHPSQTSRENGASPEAQDHDRNQAESHHHAENGVNGESVEEESIYHLPAELQGLLNSYTKAQEQIKAPQSHDHQRLLTASMNSRPDTVDAEKPRHYKPQNPSYYTPPHYPQEPLAIFDDPRLYGRIDTDSLFYSFYYRQGTYQQYLAAKALKAQSWRFHKQYQTWFQRHEEPKHITEDYEQGTYRFFDYESTWMNRRKADFKFAYKFLEDDL